MAVRPLIAIIEDDDAVRASFGELLEVCGFDVALFGTAEDFLDAAALADFRCVVTDYRLPGMDGLQASQQLFSMQPDMPVILVTSGVSGKVADKAIASGIKAVLPKPVSSDDLLEHIKEFIGERGGEVG